MNVRIIPMISAIGIGTLLAYGFYLFASDDHKLLIGVGTGILSVITLAMVMGFSYNNGGQGTNLRVAALAFFGIGLLSNGFFLIMGFSRDSYIIVHGIILLLFLWIENFIYNSAK